MIAQCRDSFSRRSTLKVLSLTKGSGRARCRVERVGLGALHALAKATDSLPQPCVLVHQLHLLLSHLCDLTHMACLTALVDARFFGGDIILWSFFTFNNDHEWLKALHKQNENEIPLHITHTHNYWTCRLTGTGGAIAFFFWRYERRRFRKFFRFTLSLCTTTLFSYAFFDISRRWAAYPWGSAAFFRCRYSASRALLAAILSFI